MLETGEGGKGPRELSKAEILHDAQSMISCFIKTRSDYEQQQHQPSCTYLFCVTEKTLNIKFNHPRFSNPELSYRSSSH